ncbi:MAG: hypothetical protein JF924_21220 [Candidatus Dormibacteraeota bacterium]|nr:hypothetical protein [Candidatus Dormibacteraeota bacterium]
MQEQRSGDRSAPSRRAVALIALALLALASSGGIYLWRSAAIPVTAPPRPFSGPPALVSVTPVSDREAWVVVHDSAASRSVLLHTGDGGASWRPSFSIEGFGTVQVVDGRRALLLGFRGGYQGRPSMPQVFSTDDAGEHWHALTLPEVGKSFRSVPFYLDADHGWLLATHSTVAGDQSPQEVALWRTLDGGRHWGSLVRIDGSHPTSPGISNADQLLSVSFQDGDTGWMATQGVAASAVLYATHDGGRGWQAVPLPAGPPGPAREDWLYVGSPVLSRDGRGVLPVVDRDVNRTWLYQTQDGGASWTNPYYSPGTGVLNVVFVDGSVGWANDSGAAWVTSDSGRSWLAATGLPGALQFGEVAPVSASVAWVQGVEVGSGGPARWAMFRTGDAGLHWTRVSQPAIS